MINKLSTIELIRKYRHTFNTDYTADANCQAAWLMTEGSGDTVADATGNGFTLTAVSSGHPAWDSTDVPFAVSGSAPNSLNFTPNDYSTAGDFTGAESTFSIVLWMNCDDYGDYNAPLAKTNSSYPDPFDIYTGVLNGGLNFYWGNGSATSNDYGFITTNAAIGSGAWVHLACVCAGKAAAGNSVYFNGVLQTSIYASKDMVSDFANHASGTRMGGRGDGATHLDGKETETAYFNDVLTSTEINEIYDYGLAGQQGQYYIYLFKDYNGAPAGGTVTWIGQSSTDCSVSTAYLQIYNETTDTWITIDFDNTTAKHTDFTLTGTFPTSGYTADDFFTSGNHVNCRVYQLL